MSINNGKISKLPVSIGDARTALNDKSVDLGTLCLSDKVKKFAKYKPIKYLKNNVEPIAVQCDTAEKTNYDANLWKGNMNEVGGANSYSTENGLKMPTLFQTTYTGESDVRIVSQSSGGNSFTYQFNGTGPKISGETTATTFNNVFNKDWQKTKVWERELPSVYRLSDFANYNNNASPDLISVNFPNSVTLTSSQSFFTIRGIANNRDIEDGLMPSDFTNFKNLCLRIGNYEVRNQFNPPNTIAFPIPKIVYTGKTNIEPILYIRGVDKKGYAKYIGCKFSDNSIVRKSIPITILGNQYKLQYEFGCADGGFYCTTASSIHNKEFYRNGDWIDKEQMGREWKSIRLINFYWKAWLRKPNGSSGELPSKNITFRCILQDENYDDMNCIVTPMILGEYTTNFNGNTSDDSNYQGYFFKTPNSTSNSDPYTIRFVDQENQDIAPMVDNYFAPILTENPKGVERYTKEQNIAVRCRIRMQIVIDGVVFNTIDVPVNGDGHSLGYIWDNTPIPSTAQTQITDMHGGYYIETYTGTTNTEANLYGDDTTAIVYTNMPSANVPQYCLQYFGTTNYMSNVFNSEDDKSSFNAIIDADTAEQEDKYTLWQFNN